MAKILVSWLAVQNDFTPEGNVRYDGPTCNFHTFHYANRSYEKHILLYTPDKKTEIKKMMDFLHQQFGNHVVEPKKVDVGKVHEDLLLIKARSEQLLLEYKDYEIDILLSTGSGIMRIAWYICHTTLGLNTHLLQIMPPEGKKVPHLVEIQTEPSTTPYYAIIRENTINEKQEKNIIITDTLQKVYDKALKVAQVNTSVLIIGNTGTGKEELARYIHENSPRRNKKFIPFNCSAFTETTLESRLFGHKKGAFTGADQDHKGIFEQADGGTVFLDEIGDISPAMQVALLRFLQFKEIQPLNGTPKKVDVRVIAATNKNIEFLLRNNQFRSDLFYRIAVVLHLPDFRTYPNEEKDQIIDFFIENLRKKFRKNKPLKLTDQLRAFLHNYFFPGNFRELLNILENLYIFADEIASLEHIPHYLNVKNISNSLKLEDVKRNHIASVLNMCNGNKSRAAKILGISLNMLKKYIKDDENQ